MVGAGIVCLELGGEHRSETGLEAAKWIHRHKFEPYNNSWHPEDRYHYSVFYCSQAMFQLGGDDWHRFFPRLLNVLAEAQHADGSWDPETANGYKGDGKYGNVYTTALAVLALSTPYQLLPIYQREARESSSATAAGPKRWRTALLNVRHVDSMPGAK